jgi:hypothetical protein
MYVSYIPAPAYIRLVERTSVGLTAILCTIYFVRGFKARRAIWEDALSSRAQLAVGMLLTPFAMYLVLVSSLGWAIPALIHPLIASDTQESFRVYAPRFAYLNTTALCKGALTIQRDAWFNSRLCHVPQAVYEDVSDGDILIVTGSKSVLGFRSRRRFLGDIEAHIQDATSAN